MNLVLPSRVQVVSDVGAGPYEPLQRPGILHHRTTYGGPLRTRDMGDGEQLTGEAAVAMLLFSLASSSLLLINKMCVHYLPAPAFISTAQFLSATLTSVVRLPG